MSKGRRKGRRLTRRGRVVRNLIIIVIVALFLVWNNDSQLTKEGAFRYAEKQAHFGPSEIAFVLEDLHSSSGLEFTGADDLIVGRAGEWLVAGRIYDRFPMLHFCSLETWKNEENRSFSCQAFNISGSKVEAASAGGTGGEEESYIYQVVLAGFVNDEGICRVEVETRAGGRYSTENIVNGLVCIEFLSDVQGEAGGLGDEKYQSPYYKSIWCYDKDGNAIYEGTEWRWEGRIE